MTENNYDTICCGPEYQYVVDGECALCPKGEIAAENIEVAYSPTVVAVVLPFTNACSTCSELQLFRFFLPNFASFSCFYAMA